MGSECYLKCIENINLELLDLFGIDYLIDHVLIEIKKRNKDKVYKIYISDALRAIANNTAQIALKKQSYILLEKRWIDIIDYKNKTNEQPEDDPRSCDEIVSDMWKRIRGKGEE